MPDDEMINSGLRLLETIDAEGSSRAAAARKLGFSPTQARIRIAAAERFLKHPRNKKHPKRKLLERQL